MRKIFLLLIIQSLFFLKTTGNILHVTNSLDNATGCLRYTILTALANDTIDFGLGIDSVIINSQEIVISKNLTIIGAVNKTIIGGNYYGVNVTRLLVVNQNINLKLINIICKKGYIYSGYTYLGGGAIYNKGIVDLVSCVFKENVSNCDLSSSKGAAIYNEGSLRVLNTDFTSNKSRGGNYKLSGNGAAIYNYLGVVDIKFSRFIDNFSNNGGGAICNNHGVMTIEYCDFNRNTNFDYFQTQGYGGAIFNTNFGDLTINECNFTKNYIYSRSTGTSSGGVYAYGGALYNDLNCIIKVSKSRFLGNYARATNDASSGVAKGGAIFNKGISYIINSTFYANEAEGTGYSTYLYQGLGAAIFNENILNLESSTISENHYIISHTPASGGSVYNTDTLYLKNNVIANTVGSAFKTDLVNSGRIFSLGYNLISIYSGSFTVSSGDLIGTTSSTVDAGIDTAGTSDASTLVLKLKSNSVCINTGDSQITYLDQLHSQRISIADKGAIEYNGVNSCILQLDSFKIVANKCFNGVDGSIKLFTSDNVNYSCLWNQGGVGDSLHHLSSGMYQAFIFDTLGCTLKPSFQITEPNMVISYLPQINICSGDSAFIFDSFKKVSGQYSNILTSIIGCDSLIKVTLNVNSLPIISVTPSTSTICQNDSVKLSSSGASTYSWSTGDMANLITAIPAISSSYTVFGTDANGCVGVAEAIINVNPIPTIAVNSGSICIGQSFTITPNGASTYTYSNGSDVVSPQADASYSVSGTDANGCVSSVDAVSTVTVNALPTINAVSSSSSVCLGTSAAILASGATTYTWSTGTIASTETVSASISSTYSVTGTDANNCSNTQTVSLTVDNTCADVWPGDANSDGTADNLDMLELGLHFTQTGTPRTTASNNWQPYFSNNWTGTIANGKNLNHSDCNGDGTINDDDTLAIYNNYGLTHAFKTAQTTTVNPQLSIVPDQPIVVKGMWGTASIYLGDATIPANDINGVAFTVDFDKTLIEPNSIYLEYQNSFIDASQNLYFRKLEFTNGKIFTATTHTVNTNVNGFGKIAVLHYKILSSLTTDQVLNIGVSQGNQSDASGVITPLASGTGTLMAIGSSVGVQESLMSNNILISPNPTNGILNISFNSLPQNTKIELYNSIGALVLTEATSSKNNTIHMSDLANGMYFIKVIEDNKVVAVKKIVRE